LATTDDRNDSVAPGRSITAIGNVIMISRQRCQRWKSRSESAPMIQTKSTPGFFRRTSASVSAV